MWSGFGSYDCSAAVQAYKVTLLGDVRAETRIEHAGKREAEFPPAPPRCRNEVYSSYLPA